MSQLLRFCFAACLVAIFVGSAGGCLITSRKSIDESGVQVSSATLSQVATGETSASWLIATLGDPTRIKEVPDQANTKIYVYDHVVEHREKGSVFVLFAGSTNKRKVSRTYFEVANDIVTRHWTETTEK